MKAKTDNLSIAMDLVSLAHAAHAYPKEYAEADCVIANAMGVTGNPPRFHGDLVAKEMLIEWLAGDDDRWREFADALAWHGGLDTAEMNEVVRFYMLASPLQIAKAAIDAIEITERLKQL